MTFKFRKGGLIYVCIMALIFAIFVVAGIKQSGFDAGSAFFVCALFFLLVLAFIAYVIGMDVVVDDNGIYRIFFGWRVLFLKWSNVKIIKDVVKKGLGGRPVRFFYVIPVAGVSLSFWLGGVNRFTDGMHDFSAFVDAMNMQMRSHNIRAERIRGLDIELCDEILVSDRRRFKMP